MTRLLTAQEVAEQLQVPATHVYRLARTGGIPTIELGRYKRFEQTAVDAWLKSLSQPVKS